MFKVFQASNVKFYWYFLQWYVVHIYHNFKYFFKLFKNYIALRTLPHYAPKMYKFFLNTTPLSLTLIY